MIIFGWVGVKIIEPDDDALAQMIVKFFLVSGIFF